MTRLHLLLFLLLSYEIDQTLICAYFSFDQVPLMPSSLALLLSKTSDKNSYLLSHPGSLSSFPDDSNTKKDHICCMLMMYSWKDMDALDISV